MRIKGETDALMGEMKWSRQSIIDWKSFLREVYIDWSVTHSLPKLGGVGRVVEIDEAKVGKRKYNCGRVVEGQWLFGDIDRESGDFFIVPVESRNTETLLAIIRDRIADGTTIMSDCWRAYNCLETLHHPTIFMKAFRNDREIRTTHKANPRRRGRPNRNGNVTRQPPPDLSMIQQMIEQTVTRAMSALTIRPPDLPAVTAMPSVSNRAMASPATSILFPRKIADTMQKWNLTFNGSADSLGVEEFIYRVRSLTDETLESDFQSVCKHMHILFVGKARDWFWRYHKQVDRIVWSEFCEGNFDPRRSFCCCVSPSPPFCWKRTNLRLQFLYCAGAAFEHIHKLLYRRGALALRWSAAVQRSPLGTVLRPSL
ncbi:hypothetical protein ACLKA7_007588 [Drosophila subpalustris]